MQRKREIGRLPQRPSVNSRPWEEANLTIAKMLSVEHIKAQNEILARCTEALGTYEKQFSGHIKRQCI